jgi:ClpP class serine protease
MRSSRQGDSAAEKSDRMSQRGTPCRATLTVIERKEPKDIDDTTLILADVARKALTQVRSTVRGLLADRLPAEQADTLADTLTRGAWTHDYPITAEEATALGLPVSTTMPTEIYQFMRLFPQPTRTRASVEYIPLPHRRETGHGS